MAERLFESRAAPAPRDSFDGDFGALIVVTVLRRGSHGEKTAAPLRERKVVTGSVGSQIRAARFTRNLCHVLEDVRRIML